MRRQPANTNAADHIERNQDQMRDLIVVIVKTGNRVGTATTRSFAEYLSARSDAVRSMTSADGPSNSELSAACNLILPLR